MSGVTAQHLTRRVCLRPTHLTLPSNHEHYANSTPGMRGVGDLKMLLTRERCDDLGIFRYIRNKQVVKVF